jgi:S-adenosylmethionine decarboxylase proenzyme
LTTHGRHLLVEYIGCDFDVLNDVARIERLMCKAAVAAQTNIVASVFKPFHPQGVSGVVVVEESHLSIHTWPERGYAAIDFFTCGEGLPENAHEVLMAGLQAAHFEMIFVARGHLDNGALMKIHSHTIDEVADTTVTREEPEALRPSSFFPAELTD